MQSYNFRLENKGLITKIIAIVLILTIIYNSGSVLMTVNNKIGFSLILLSIILMFIKYPNVRKKIKLNYFNFSFILLFLLTIISMIVNINFNYIDTNIRYLVIIFFAYYFVKLIDFEAFVKYFTKIMVALVIISLIPFCITKFLQIDILQYLPIIENINGVRYYNGLLFYFYTYSQKRNMGVFWEPSIYSSYIIIAMIYEICYKKPRLGRLIILSIGLISTGSTGGFFLFPFVILLYLMKNSSYINNFFIQVSLIIGSILAYLNADRILNFLVKINPLVFSKLLRENATSVFDRTFSPLANIELFLNNPIFGNGLGEVDNLFSDFLITQTSTSTYYLAAFGIFGIIYTINIIYGVFKQKNFNLSIKILLVTILILIVNKEPHTRLLLTHIIIFYLIKPNTRRIKNIDSITGS